MLHRFGTYEEAALFVSMKRSEGWYAEILHEHAAAFWGPLAMTGVAVWVSEEAADEDEEVPDLKLEGPTLPWVLSLLGGMLILGVPVVALGLFLFTLARHAMHYPREAGGVVIAVMLFIGFAILALVLLGLCAGILSRWIHAFWDKAHRLHQPAVLMHVLLALLLLLIATELGGLVLWSVLEFLFMDGTY